MTTSTTQPASTGTPVPLQGRLAVVTGAARGIGAEIARTLAGAGARVVLLDVLADDVRATAASVGATAVTADLRDPADARRGMADAIAALGGLDILVNNAGVLRFANVLDISRRRLGPHLRRERPLHAAHHPGGRTGHAGPAAAARIINMASMGGKLGSPGQAHYCASKAAVIAFTRVCAMELGPSNINVNCICPGYVLTEMGTATRTPEMVAAWTAKSPLGRLAGTDDVAAMALFLASDGSSYCTGQAFNVSGGMVMH